MGRINVSLAILSLAMVGCGTANLELATRTAAITNVAIEAKAIPPASAFKTFNNVTVSQVLPADNQGLTHQNFIVKAKDGSLYEVNNSTTHGKEVPGLKVGVVLNIKGTTYQDAKRKGIHWTHHANQLQDAGWIQTVSDGKFYE